MGFVGNLHGFSAVKEFWKSVKNWQSYRHEFGVLLFWDTVYKKNERSIKELYDVVESQYRIYTIDAEMTEGMM